MKKTVMILIGLVLSLIVSFSAFADEMTNEETVTEETTTTSDIEIGVSQDTTAGQSAETSSTGSVDSSGNEITEINVDKTATIGSNSFNGLNGIISVNQAPGSMNNQGNSVSISFVKDGAGTILHSGSSFNQSSSGNMVTAEGSNISNTIKGDVFGGKVFSTVSGVIGINQSAGNVNSQNNIACISIGGNPVVSLSPADLGMISGHNTVFETGVNRTDTISSFAFEGVSGVISVNQSSGNMNNQTNVVTISVHQFPFP